MWTWSEHTGKSERMVFVAKNNLTKKISECKIFMAGACPSFLSRCVLRTHRLYPYCALVTCLSWLRHCQGLVNVMPYPLVCIHAQFPHTELIDVNIQVTNFLILHPADCPLVFFYQTTAVCIICDSLCSWLLLLQLSRRVTLKVKSPLKGMWVFG